MEEQLKEDQLEDMIHDVGVEVFAQANVYKTISVDAEMLLYIDSTKFTPFLLDL